MPVALDTLAAADSRAKFDQQIAESLEDGDAWLHKVVKSEVAAPSQFIEDGRWIIEINDLLDSHSRRWSEQWLADRPEKAKETAKSTRQALIELQSGANQTRKVFTAEQLRNAARSFSRRTSIGTDNWKFTELANLPDIILESLAELLSDIQQDAISPLPVFNNIMATLPKRTVDHALWPSPRPYTDSSWSWIRKR